MPPNDDGVERWLKPIKEELFTVKGEKVRLIYCWGGRPVCGSVWEWNVPGLLPCKASTREGSIFINIIGWGLFLILEPLTRSLGAALIGALIYAQI